jgi:hypothetical protein
LGERHGARGEHRTQDLSRPQSAAGDIVLRTPARRAIFIAGLIGALILALIAQYLYLR